MGTFYKNVLDELKTEFASIFGVGVVAKHEKYLGLPALVRQSKREIFHNLKDRVWARLQSWRCRKLSQGDKVVLLKSVVQTMPIFVVGCFFVPASICRELESMMADFLWHNKTSMRVHWISWAKLCASKSEEGLGAVKLTAAKTGVTK
ncbi:UNVERIFIED_CONTAM: hypothetical protein Slati_2124000 [Sesamum latifolium]|uniref:Uncharacterized protein n=1 Tax=Sesamum latifolium TaxID=2727402 RepID=A0AAW2WR73_9LAMI